MKKFNELIERSIIVNKPMKRPYGVRIYFKTWTLGTLGNLEKVCLLTNDGLNLTIEPTNKVPWEAGRPMKIELEGFPNATQAESAGRKLTTLLLWHAISHGHSLLLNYQTPEPVYIYERNRSEGFSCFGIGDSIIQTQKVITNLCSKLANIPEISQKFQIAMELFAAARMESSERAKLISMISSLEMLPNKKSLGDEVKKFIRQTLKELKNNEQIDVGIKNSISSSIGKLKNESITQSLKRYVNEMLPEIPDGQFTIEKAYQIRSQIVHSGRADDSDIDLNDIISRIEHIIRAIFIKTLKINC